jgi:hypothetical protein
MYLDDYSYGQFLRLVQVARAKGAFIVRPEMEGEPWIIRQRGKVVARCATMDEARSELEWMPDR